MRVVVLTASLVAMMSLITACSGSKCESVCADANACEITERATDVDCPEFCQDAEKLDQRIVSAGLESCDAKLQTHLACWEQNSAQTCNKDFSGCAESGTAWTACMDVYCDAVLAKIKAEEAIEEETGEEVENKTNPDPNCLIAQERPAPGAPPVSVTRPTLFPF